MPQGAALKVANLSRRKKIFYTLTWPAYFSSERVGLEAAIMAKIGFFAIITTVAFDLLQGNVFSLAPSDIQEPVISENKKITEINNAIAAEANANWQDLAVGALKNKESVLLPEAMLAPSAEQVAGVVYHPIQAWMLIAHYYGKNGLISDNTPPSFSQIHYRKRPIDNYGAAIIAAYLLEQRGYKPYVLCLKTSWWTTVYRPLEVSLKMVYLFKQNGKFGYISLGGVCEPKFTTLKELADELSAKDHVKYVDFFMFDLDEQCPGWQKNNPGVRGYQIWRKL